MGTRIERQQAARLGMKNVNTDGKEMVIVGYLNSQNITVRFTESGNQRRARYDHFLKGNVKDTVDAPTAKSVTIDFGSLSIKTRLKLMLCILKGNKATFNSNK